MPLSPIRHTPTGMYHELCAADPRPSALLPAVPKASATARMRENLGALSFELSDAEMAALDGLEAGDRYSFDPRYIA